MNVRIEPTWLSTPTVKFPGVLYHELLRKLPTMLRNCGNVAASVCVAKFEPELRPDEQLRAVVDVKKISHRINIILLSKKKSIKSIRNTKKNAAALRKARSKKIIRLRDETNPPLCRDINN